MNNGVISSRYRIAPGPDGLAKIDWGRVSLIDAEAFELIVTKDISVIFTACYDAAEGMPFSLKNYIVGSKSFDANQAILEQRMREYNRYRREMVHRYLRKEREYIFFDRQEQDRLRSVFLAMRIFCEVSIFYHDEKVDIENLPIEAGTKVVNLLNKMGVEVSMRAQDFIDYQKRRRVKQIMTKQEFLRRAQIMDKSEAKKIVVVSSIAVAIGTVVIMSGVVRMAGALKALAGNSEEVILVKND